MTSKQEKYSCWSELEEDLLVTIVERFSVYTDYLRFGSVCVSWRKCVAAAAAATTHTKPQQRCFPLLLVPCCGHDPKENEVSRADYPGPWPACSVGLLSIAENGKVYHYRHPDHGHGRHHHDDLFKGDNYFGTRRGDLMRMKCVGSSHGWLAMIDHGQTNKDAPPDYYCSSSLVYLINLFTGSRLSLPPIFTYYSNAPPVLSNNIIRDNLRLSLTKVVVLSSTPTPTPPSSSSSSSSSTVLAVATFGQFGFFFHPFYPGMAFSIIPADHQDVHVAEQTWTKFASDLIMDVLFYKDHLYAISAQWNKEKMEIEHHLLIFHMNMDMDMDVTSTTQSTTRRRVRVNPKLIDTIKFPEGYRSGGWGQKRVGRLPYLVELCGDLLMVVREVQYQISSARTDSELDHKTIGFAIFKLLSSPDPHQNKPQGSCNNNYCSTSTSNTRVGTWEQIHSLGDDTMLFLGLNHSFSVSSVAATGSSYIRGNCIYFTPHHFIFYRYILMDDSEFDFHELDLGVFDLKDKSVERLPMLSQALPRRKGHCYCPYSPIWLIPNSY